MCAWTAPRTWVTSENPTAATMNAHIKDNFAETIPAQASNTPRLFFADAANSTVERKPAADYVATAETRASSTFGALTTAGPAVSSTTTQDSIVFLQFHGANTSALGRSLMSVAVSGATTRVSTVDHAAVFTSSAANDAGVAFVVVTYGLGGSEGNLTAGTNTFTSEYAATAGTSTFKWRHLTVVPM